MKFIYWGKNIRGVVCLKTLLENNYVPEAVVTQPATDEPIEKSVKKLAEQKNLPVICPEGTPNSSDIESILKSYSPELFILSGYSRILKPNILAIPRLGSLNLHGGLLPKYRGCSPLNWQILNGEKEIGLSIIFLDSGIDTGDIVLSRTFPVGMADDINDVVKVSLRMFPEMLLEVMEQISNGSVNKTSQDPQAGEYWCRRQPEDSRIIWPRYSGMEVLNHIRSVAPPVNKGAFAFYEGKKVVFQKACLPDYPFNGRPGRIIRKDKYEGIASLLVACHSGAINILNVFSSVNNLFNI